MPGDCAWFGLCGDEPDDEVGRGDLIGSIETFNEFGELLNDRRGYEVAGGRLLSVFENNLG